MPWLLLEVLSVDMLGCNVDCSASVEQTKLIHLQGEDLHAAFRGALCIFTGGQNCF